MTKTTYKKYSKYKPSGIDWLGDIPVGWNLSPVRAILKERKEENKKLEIDNILSVIKGKGVIRYADKGNVGNKSSERPETYKIVRANDLVLNSMNLVIGSVGMAHEEGVTSSVYIIYQARPAVADPNFYHYIFQAVPFQKHLASYGRGIMELREAVKERDIRNQLVILLPLKTQKRIADFLDEKTKIIDGLVAKKQWLIELLREKRSVLITRAVTKGLNPKAKMKPSGIDWLGDIPESWKTISLGNLLAYEQPGPYICNTIDPTRHSEDITPVLTANKGFIIGYTEEKNDVYKKLPVIIFDDFTTNKKFVDFPFKIRSSALKILKIRKAENDIRFVFRSMEILGFHVLEHNRHWISIYSKEKIAHPSLQIQKQIANFLDTETAKMDKATALIESQIEKLKEYRSSLIYHAVTGKIRV